LTLPVQSNAVVRAADLVEGGLGHVDEIGLTTSPSIFLRVDEMGHAELLAPGLVVGVDVDADDHVGAGHFQALDHVQADAAQAEDHGLGAVRPWPC
jgi:hypothetical protein